MCVLLLNPFTPESNQFHIFPAASSETNTSHSMQNLLFIAYSDETWMVVLPLLTTSRILYISLKGLQTVLYGLRSERAHWCDQNYDWFAVYPLGPSKF